ncbi:hypothetical protein PBI_THONKO_88 [Mycobacterium phage Thonko]|uniref:Uncharacterized protein n=1 Tax=Mycobacterium phage Thonko TaxID=2282910 RepID=A0A346FCD3_9CAUD|nr:hypothetical protein I5G57_gp088 [Mycobacterium phage Thonko]AXN53358.1 hypothetical protein PBI_THONKO_88 [Mycobacterium phage Thonko]
MTRRAYRRGRRATYDTGCWWFGAGYLPAGSPAHWWHRGEHRRHRFSQVLVGDLCWSLAIEAELRALKAVSDTLARAGRHRRAERVHTMKPGTVYYANVVGWCELNAAGWGVSLDLRDPIATRFQRTTTIEFVLHNVNPEVYRMLTGVEP